MSSKPTYSLPPIPAPCHCQAFPTHLLTIQNLGSNPNAKRMQEVVSFYKKLPQGAAPAPKKPTTPWGKYKAAYFDGDNASGKPLLHLAVAIVVLGYTWEYNSHLKHHH